jgi:hypothetical protein
MDTQALHLLQSQVEPVARHPRVRELGRDGHEQLRVEAFARDLAAWLAGAPRSSLRALARVIVLVGGRGLRDARAMCTGLPLLAIEAAARSTEALWPLLRELEAAVEEPEPPEDEAPGGEGGGGSSEGEQGPTSQAAIEQLADGDLEEDPELEALTRQLKTSADPLGELSKHLDGVGEPAWQGAKAGEALARTLESLVPGMSWGTTPGELQATLAHRLDDFVALLEQVPALRQLAARLGRMEADLNRRASSEGGSEEVTGVRMGGEVARALPGELALLGDPETEDLFYLRLIERRLVSLELTGAGLGGVAFERNRGPVIACIDTSGSMQGPPEEAAKALVLAIARQVLPQGRTVHLLLFGAAGEKSELRLRRGRGGLEHLLEFLLRGFSGGTDFDTPLLRAMELLQEADLRAADVLVVTDGYAHASHEVVAAVAKAREGRGLRVWSVLLGTSGAYGVEAFSDEVWVIDPRLDTPLELLRRMRK